MQDFFISYNKADELWAMGIGDWLDQAGYTTVFQQQDFVPATNFAAEMHRALQNMHRMIMVLSPDYLSAKFPLAEWTAAFATDPACENRTLIPVRVRECKPDGLLRPIVYIDLVGLNAIDARSTFLNGIASVLNHKRPRSSSVPAQPKQKAKRSSRLSQKVTGDQNTTIQAAQIENLTIKMSGKKLPSIQPADVVGANVEMRSYIEYLIERYIDWRQYGIDRGIDQRRFHPSMIHRDIKRDFGARTYLVPQTRFDDLVHYLQVRINDTIRGRNNPHPNYHSFHAHLDLLHGKDKRPPTLVGSVVRGLQHASQKAQEINCINNLKQVGLAARMWANDHGDVLPNEFGSMKTELVNEKILCCPTNGARYELLSPGIPKTDPFVVYARCSLHRSVVLADGSAHRLGKRSLIQKDGKWKIE